MDVNPLFLLEFVLFSGVALAWAAYEFWSARPDKDEAKSAPPDDAGHPEGERLSCMMSAGAPFISPISCERA